MVCETSNDIGATFKKAAEIIEKLDFSYSAACENDIDLNTL